METAALVCCVGALSRQCGELSCGTVSPHGPGAMKYPPPFIVIGVLSSCLVKKLDKLAFNDPVSTEFDESKDIDSLALKIM